MKRGCALMLAALAALTLFELYLFEQREIELSRWIAFLLAAALNLALSNFVWLLVSIRHAFAFSKPAHSWKDGMELGVSGKIVPLGQPLVAPISGTAAVVYEYKVTPQVEGATACILEGEGMCASAIQGRHGSLRIVGFPLLRQPMERARTEEGYDRFASYVAGTIWKEKVSSVSGSLAELRALLADDDGVVKNDRIVGTLPFEVPRGEASADSADLEESAPDDEPEPPPQPLTPEFFRDVLPPYDLMERTISMGAEVTALGTYRSNPPRLDVGAGLENVGYTIYLGGKSEVLGRLFRSSILSILFWGVLALGGHVAVYEPSLFGRAAELLKERFAD